MRLGDETLTGPTYGGALVAPDRLRQVFNDTNAETLWLIIGAPEELEFLQGSTSEMDLSLSTRRTLRNCLLNSAGLTGHRKVDRYARRLAFDSSFAR